VARPAPHSTAAIVAAVLDHVVIGPGKRGLNRFDELDNLAGR
jgi:hypothetical protein